MPMLSNLAAVSATDLETGDQIANVGRVRDVSVLPSARAFVSVLVDTPSWSLVTGTPVLTTTTLVLHGADIVVVVR